MTEPDVDVVDETLVESGEPQTENYVVSTGIEVKVVSEFPLDATRVVDVAMKHSDGTVEGANEVLLRWGYPPTVVKVVDMTVEESVISDWGLDSVEET